MGIELGCWCDFKVCVIVLIFKCFVWWLVELIGEFWIGWELGVFMLLLLYGFFGYVVMSSNILGDVIELVVKFFCICGIIV